MESRADHIDELYKASHSGCVATLNRLINEDPLILHNISLNQLNETPLHISALLGHLDFTKALLRQNPTLVAELDSFRRSPLHFASANGHTEIVRALLHINKDVCMIPDQDGRIPLHLAAMRGRVGVIRELLNAKPESIKVTLDGNTVLHLCVLNNHLQALKLLVSLADDPNLLVSKNHDGKTILHLAATLYQLENIRFLLSVPEISTSANEIQDMFIKVGFNKDMDPSNQQPSPPLASKPRWWLWCRELMKVLFETQEGESIVKTQEMLMLVATVMATITFQAAITNPPGGFWSMEELNEVCGKRDDEGYFAGDYTHLSICKYYLVLSSRVGYYGREDFERFIASNTISFMASITVMFLTISGLPVKNKFFWFVSTLAMLTSVACLSWAYVTAIDWVVPFPFVHRVSSYLFFFGFVYYFGICLFVFVALFYAVSLLLWILKIVRKSQEPSTTIPILDPIGVQRTTSMLS